jgi:hypothetical protein
MDSNNDFHEGIIVNSSPRVFVHRLIRRRHTADGAFADFPGGVTNILKSEREERATQKIGKSAIGPVGSPRSQQNDGRMAFFAEGQNSHSGLVRISLCWVLLGANLMFLTSPITNVSTRGWPAYAGGKTFATNADQNKEMAQVAEHEDLGSFHFGTKKEL